MNKARPNYFIKVAQLFFREDTNEKLYEEPVIPEEIKEDFMKEYVIRVNGMMCKHCAATVEKACKKIPGTETAVVDLQAKNVTVTGTADLDALKQAIIAEDFEVVEE